MVALRHIKLCIRTFTYIWLRVCSDLIAAVHVTTQKIQQYLYCSAEQVDRKTRSLSHTNSITPFFAGVGVGKEARRQCR